MWALCGIGTCNIQYTFTERSTISSPSLFPFRELFRESWSSRGSGLWRGSNWTPLMLQRIGWTCACGPFTSTDCINSNALTSRLPSCLSERERIRAWMKYFTYLSHQSEPLGRYSCSGNERITEITHLLSPEFDFVHWMKSHGREMKELEYIRW